MAKVDLHLCPETGICSIIRGDGSKVDLMPNEVEDLRGAAGDRDSIRQTLGGVDTDFSGKLDAAELDQIAAELG